MEVDRQWEEREDEHSWKPDCAWTVEETDRQTETKLTMTVTLMT